MFELLNPLPAPNRHPINPLPNELPAVPRLQEVTIIQADPPRAMHIIHTADITPTHLRPKMQHLANQAQLGILPKDLHRVALQPPEAFPVGKHSRSVPLQVACRADAGKDFVWDDGGEA